MERNRWKPQRYKEREKNNSWQTEKQTEGMGEGGVEVILTWAARLGSTGRGLAPILPSQRASAGVEGWPLQLGTRCPLQGERGIALLWPVNSGHDQ